MTTTFQVLAAHYKVLGVKRDTPWEQVKDAHRQLIREFHPDRFDAADPKREESEERAKQINHAFQEISKSRKQQLQPKPTVIFTKVDFSPDSPKRPRAKTVEQMVVVRNGVVYSVKKMRRLRDSRLHLVKSGVVELGSKAGNRLADALSTLRQRAAKRSEQRAAAAQRAVNVADFAWSDTSEQNVVHFVDGKKLIRNGSFRS